KVSRDLAELKCALLVGELEFATNGDEHAAVGARGLPIEDADTVPALLEKRSLAIYGFSMNWAILLQCLDLKQQERAERG
ncbi:hypothetical protein TorRG33x02_317850, partial [Trema orientale]